MKTPLALVFALALATLASAADLVLKDGRVLRGAVITKQDPTTVTVRHSAGFTQVEKAKLPDELAAQYPIDEAAAAAQHAAELARAEQINQDLARKAERVQVARLAQPTKEPKKPAPVQIAFRPLLRDSDDRWKWRRRELTLGPVDMAGLRWEKIHEARGGTHVRTPIKLARPYWRVTVEHATPYGRPSYASAIVSNADGDKLAACLSRNGTTTAATGNADGDAMLDVIADGGSLVVIVEQAVPAY